VKNNKLKFITWKVALLLSLLPVYGCVGVAFISSTGTEFSDVYYKPASEHGELKLGEEQRTISKAQILLAWSEPDEIISVDESTVRWVYYRELAWHGMVVFAVVPIPLIIPFGSRNTEVIIEEDIVTKILYHTSDLAPICAASLFGISHPGVTLGGVECHLKKTPWRMH